MYTLLTIVQADDSTFFVQKACCGLKRNTVYMLSGGQIYLEVVF